MPSSFSTSKLFKIYTTAFYRMMKLTRRPTVASIFSRKRDMQFLNSELEDNIRTDPVQQDHSGPGGVHKGSIRIEGINASNEKMETNRVGNNVEGYGSVNDNVELKYGRYGDVGRFPSCDCVVM